MSDIQTPQPPPLTFNNWCIRRAHFVGADADFGLSIWRGRAIRKHKRARQALVAAMREWQAWIRFRRCIEEILEAGRPPA